MRRLWFSSYLGTLPRGVSERGIKETDRRPETSERAKSERQPQKEAGGLGSQAALDAEVALPELAVSSSSGHGPEQVRVDLDHLLDRLGGCDVRKQKRPKQKQKKEIKKGRSEPVKAESAGAMTPETPASASGDSQIYCPIDARESTATMTPCLKMKARLRTRGEAKRGKERDRINNAFSPCGAAACTTTSAGRPTHSRGGAVRWLHQFDSGVLKVVQLGEGGGGEQGKGEGAGEATSLRRSTRRVGGRDRL